MSSKRYRRVFTGQTVLGVQRVSFIDVVLGVTQMRDVGRQLAVR